MGYELRPNNESNMKYDLDITNCEITGNTVKYTLSDGSIMQYALDTEGDIRKGSGKSCNNIELTKYQISVFEALKGLDGNEQDFTKDDLKDLTESKIIELVNNQLNGESDCEAKGATITKKSISVMFWDYKRKVMRNLTIDFKSSFFNNIGIFFRNLFSRSDKDLRAESPALTQRAKVDTNIVVGDLEEHPIEISEEIYDKVAELEDDKSMNKTTELIDTTTSKVTATSTKDVYDDMYNIIPKEYNKYIKQIAENAGVSEDLVKTFIINEGKPGSKEAALDAYKRKGDVWTIGFGHTNLCRKMDFKVKEGTTITIEKAFELLEGDIKEMKKYARTSVGTENFDNAPLSLQALFIEYCFQYGPGGRLKSPNMKANLAGGYKEAIAAGSLFEGNYSRRSAYRFMLAINDFTVEERQAALRRLKDKGNYDKILASLSGNEKKMFVDFCRFVEAGV